MSSAVLRAMARRLPAGAADRADVLGLDTYLHAVATPDGVRLDEHLNQLVERPPLARILPELAGEVRNLGTWVTAAP
jgi:hypothetical protein